MLAWLYLHKHTPEVFLISQRFGEFCEGPVTLVRDGRLMLCVLLSCDLWLCVCGSCDSSASRCVTYAGPLSLMQARFHFISASSDRSPWKQTAGEWDSI